MAVKVQILMLVLNVAIYNSGLEVEPAGTLRQSSSATTTSLTEAVDYGDSTEPVVVSFLGISGPVEAGQNRPSHHRPMPDNKPSSCFEDDTSKVMKDTRDTSNTLEEPKDTLNALEEQKDTSNTLEEQKDTSNTLEEQKDASNTLEEQKDTSNTLEEQKDTSNVNRENTHVPILIKETEHTSYLLKELEKTSNPLKEHQETLTMLKEQVQEADIESPNMGSHESLKQKMNENPLNGNEAITDEGIDNDGIPFWLDPTNIEEQNGMDKPAPFKITNGELILKDEAFKLGGSNSVDPCWEPTPLDRPKPEPVRGAKTTLNESILINFGFSLLQNSGNTTAGNADDEHVEVLLGDLEFWVCSQQILCKNRCGQSQFEHLAGGVDNDEGIEMTRGTKRRRNAEEEVSVENKDKQINMFKTQEEEIQNGNTHKRWARSSAEEHTRSSCSNATSCFCDESCVIFGDCCVDYFQSCFQVNETKEILDFIHEVRNENDLKFINTGAHILNISQNGVWEFLFHFASCEEVGTQSNWVMVNRCPVDFDATPLKEKCENSSANLLPPVTVNFISGNFTFKNAFCASCHGIGADDTEPWGAQFECDDNFTLINQGFLTIERIRELLNLGVCNMTFTPPAGSCGSRKCENGSRLSQEHVEALTKNVKNGVCSFAEFTLCQVYHLPGMALKNPSCEVCLGNTQIVQWDIIDLCGVPFPLKPSDETIILPGGGRSLPGGVLIILDITGMYSKKDKDPVYICKDDEVFDPFFLECKTLICPHGYYAYQGNCLKSVQAFFVPESSQIFPDGWSRLDVLTTTSEVKSYISCEEVLGSSQMIVEHSSFVVNKVLIIDDVDLNLTSPINSSTSLAECEETIAKEDIHVLQSIDLIVFLTHAPGLDTLKELAELAESLTLLASEADSQLITVTNMGSVASPLELCPDGGNMTPHTDFKLETIKGVVYAVFNFTQEGTYYPLNSIGYEFTIQVLNKLVTITSTAFICQSSSLFSSTNCSTVVYSINETEKNGTRIKILKSNVYYDEGEFYIWRDKVFVCSNFRFNHEMELEMNNVVFRTVNFVLTIISIVFLFLMLVIYCVLPELRTLPGKMTASLAVTMMLTFLFSLFSLVELRHNYVCPVMAAVSHVVTLAHFGWMSAIAVNMALTFGPVTNHLVKTQSHKNVFKIYNVVVWGLSISLVIVSVILDVANEKTESELELSNVTATESNYPRYGYPYCTWFSGPLWVRLVFIIIPYFITYTVNVIGFIVAIAGIHKTSKHSEKFGIKTSETARCVIYIKLSTAMGFAWVMSVMVSVFPESDVLPYVHVCLVLTQGVLLFVAFMANKKVLLLLRKRYWGKRKVTSNSETKISIVSTGSM